MTLAARPTALRHALLAALLGGVVLVGVLAGGGHHLNPPPLPGHFASWNFGIDRQPLAINPQPLPPGVRPV